jgi:hypothetical protein
MHGCEITQKIFLAACEGGFCFCRLRHLPAFRNFADGYIGEVLKLAA